jgi:quercetin dioxygenase-like cupin family protein
MRVLKIHDLPENPMDSATPIAGWTGGPVSRTRQAIIGDGQSENFRCNVVNFREGATTGWHTHDCDQILVVTSGRGMVATEKEEREITVGDVVHIKAGERHWHGAKADSPMSHITVTTVGSKSTHWFDRFDPDEAFGSILIFANELSETLRRLIFPFFLVFIAVFLHDRDITITSLDMTILRCIKKLALNPPKEREEQTERAR